MKRFLSLAGALVALALVALVWFTPLRLAAAGTVYYVSAFGNDAHSGTTTDLAFASIQHAVDVAQPGDTITLAPGVYMQDFVSRRDGAANAPITITGPADAVVQGAGAARIIEINHDYITLNGFTVDGLVGSPDAATSYRDKLIYVIGIEPGNGVTGLKILNMHLLNAGGECVRMKYFATGNEVAHNTIHSCGVHDFRFAGGGKNGEGIYIGTAPEQYARNPTPDVDVSRDNWVHHNDIVTEGNECVDIKEGATANIVEYNDCTAQRDPNSAGYDSRGNGNTFRYNKSFNNSGAGIRFGGDTPADGANNNAYYNELSNNVVGGIKFQATPQQIVCGNTMTGNTGGDAVGTYGAQFNPTQACPADVPPPVGGIGRNGGQQPPTPTPPAPGVGLIPIGNGETTVEAEAYTALHGNWTKVVGETITYMNVPNKSDEPRDDSSRLEYRLNVQQAGTYYVWVRLYGPDDSSDSVYVRMDDGDRSKVEPGSRDKWVWKKVSTNYELSVGEHTFVLSNREDGTRVDKLVFTTNSDYRP